MTPSASAGRRAARAADTAIGAELAEVQRAVASRVFGKDERIRLALACLLADGHLLIEDVPGVGKTTLAHSLAQALGLTFSRIQFTSDLMPSDILGVSVYDRNAAAFHFNAGPIFAQLVLADEVNRASPRTQSALLEAMAERQVTIEGRTRELGNPFAVIATQNPVDHSGTFALPDSQLDRFLMRIDLGYPPDSAERRLLAEGSRRRAPLEAVADAETLLRWQQAAADVHTRDAVIDYLLQLVGFTRRSGVFEQGLSPRAGLALRRAAQAWALIDGRDFVMPEDVQAVLPAVVDHRLIRRDAGDGRASALLREQVGVI
ncbi:ATPase [Salinisphaera dokdonensis CL-ES53]|uniref:ATPase n=1 Tax=Salinisphaera dokdonensis CL-ES53 TaxID=1304272 RepID=A0ABV2AWC0_9GAMM